MDWSINRQRRDLCVRQLLGIGYKHINNEEVVNSREIWRHLDRIFAKFIMHVIDYKLTSFGGNECQ